jgi:hypothetical protein
LNPRKWISEPLAEEMGYGHAVDDRSNFAS